MIDVTDEQFQSLIDQALKELPGEHVANIKNVAILYEQDPTPEQRATTKLHPFETLLGLYEGVPLARRQGVTPLFPDRITLFKGPLTNKVNTEAALLEEIKHTLWHEIAHYYGLDHEKIHALE